MAHDHGWTSRISCGDRPGGGAEGPVAVISYGLWQRRFGGAAGVIGGPLVVDGLTVTMICPGYRMVVGMM